MSNVVLEMSGDEAKLFRSFQRIIDQQKKLEGGLDNTARKSKTVGGAVNDAFTGVAKQVTSIATGFLSVSAAIGLIGNSYRAYVSSMNEIATATRKAANEIVAFAALQEPGTKRSEVMAAAGIAAKYGITDRAAAFNTIQALQSARGKTEGLAAAEQVFMMSQLGVPLEAATELEQVGAAIGAETGATARRAYVSGQLSARDPALLAKAAPALSFFQDQNLAFAAAAPIGAQFGEEIATYLKAAGIGLSSISADAFQQTLAGLGVGADATQMQRLEALSRAGIDTPEEMAAAGLTEQRQAVAVANLVTNIDEVRRLQGEIASQAVPGLFEAQRAAVEAEIPQTAIDRAAKQAEVEFSNLTAFGEQSIEAGMRELLERARAVEFRRLGIDRAMGKDLLADERVTDFEASLASAVDVHGLVNQAKSAAVERVQDLLSLGDVAGPGRASYLVTAEELAKAMKAQTRNQDEQVKLLRSIDAKLDRAAQRPNPNPIPLE